MTIATEHPDWWRAVLARDADFDGVFVYAVLSTGIYCRPSCGARKPNKDRVVFYVEAAEAQTAGFRPCLRCRPDDMRGGLGARMVRLSQFIESYDSPDRPLTLAVMSDYMKLSPSYLQRSFTRIMGVSPREYADMARLKRLKALVRDGEAVTDAVYGAGYGSSSRAYEGSSRRLGMTPGTYKRGGTGMRIGYDIVDCSLGRLLIGATERGVSAVLLGRSDAELIGQLREEYPSAVIVRDSSGLDAYIGVLREYFEVGASIPNLPLDIRVTAFQARVYEELRRIERGGVRTYGQIAAEIGRPGAARAVGNACAANPTALIVPCHRVVRVNGDPGGYRWGIRRKRALLSMEGGHGRDEMFEDGAGI